MLTIYLFTFLIVVLLFFTAKLLSDKRKVIITAEIEKISLGVFKPEMIVPEISIEYKYYFEKGIYIGKGFLLFSDFINDDFRIGFNEHQIPFLQYEGNLYLAVEHIESFLLSKQDRIKILVDPKLPYISEILSTPDHPKEIKNV